MPTYTRWLLQISLFLGFHGLTRWLADRLGITTEDRNRLAAEEATRRRLAHLANLRCPLCDTEIPNAWTVGADGQIGARPRSHCPTCDFRLDACRHCQHFAPGGVSGSSLTGHSIQPIVNFSEEDFTTGGCRVYRGYVSVYDLYGEQMADRLAMMGAESVRVPKRIDDSYIPLPECTAFALAPKRLQHSGARLDRRWRAWLRWLSLARG